MTPKLSVWVVKHSQFRFQDGFVWGGGEADREGRREEKDLLPKLGFMSDRDKLM